MGALAHYLEEAGVATTQISLIREHTEKIRPPRALWVPFELGRPLGVPNDPAFQRRVLLATLELLNAPNGPVLMDFPEEATGVAGENGQVLNAVRKKCLVETDNSLRLIGSLLLVPMSET